MKHRKRNSNPESNRLVFAGSPGVESYHSTAGAGAAPVHDSTPATCAFRDVSPDVATRSPGWPLSSTILRCQLTNGWELLVKRGLTGAEVPPAFSSLEGAPFLLLAVNWIKSDVTRQQRASSGQLRPAATACAVNLGRYCNRRGVARNSATKHASERRQTDERGRIPSSLHAGPADYRMVCRMRHRLQFITSRIRACMSSCRPTLDSHGGAKATCEKQRKSARQADECTKIYLYCVADPFC